MWCMCVFVCEHGLGFMVHFYHNMVTFVLSSSPLALLSALLLIQVVSVESVVC